MKQYLLKQNKTNSLIQEEPDPDLNLIVVIPAYKETEIALTLRSLYNCDPTDFAIEIIVLVNGKESDSIEIMDLNKACFEICKSIQSELSNPKLKLHVLKDLDFTERKGGVGLARKQLMDEACHRFGQLEKPKGIIVNLDADCLLAPSYFVEIHSFFSVQKQFSAASIHFEHRLSNEDIILYELHLRYFIGMQCLLNFPFAFQTVGSAMAVTTDIYAAVGGMNTRKAGEDFYFMHKFIKNGVCGKINSTTVFPSARVSDRVPFGTGKAVGDIQDGISFLTYNPKSFELYVPMLDGLEKLYLGNIPENAVELKEYLKSINFEVKVEEIRNNTTSFDAFKKRFFQFFDAFKLMKSLHYLRENGYSDVDLKVALPVYFEKIGIEYKGVCIDSLESLREFDKSK